MSEEIDKKILRSCSGDPGRFNWWCPGCGESHAVKTAAPGALPGPIWGWNGSIETPTFAPSIKVTGKRPMSDAEYDRAIAGEKLEIPDRICHVMITDGQIQFLSDCTHALAGKTVPMEAF